jgi:uncharacterized protein (TIGR02996 family)
MSDELIAEWRRTRSPALADRIEALGSLAHGVKASAKVHESKRQVLALLEQPDDPRMTVLFVGWLLKPRWPGSGSFDIIWKPILERLVKLRDRRAIAPMRRAVAQPPQFFGVAYTKTILAAVGAAADQLEKSCKKIPEEPTDPKLFAGPATDADLLAIVAPVFANPDDEATRLVAADALVERGSPWGELIVLQLKKRRTKAEDERIAAIVDKHGKLLAGPLWEIAKKGFHRYERGFLAEVWTNKDMVGRRRWEEAAAAPHWATVERLMIEEDTPKWWVTMIAGSRALARVQSVGFSRYQPLGTRLVRDGDRWQVVAHSQGPLEAFVRGLPDGERAKLTVAPSVKSRATILSWI